MSISPSISHSGVLLALNDFVKSIPDKAHISQTLHIHQLVTYKERNKESKMSAFITYTKHRERTSGQSKGSNPALKEHGWSVDTICPECRRTERSVLSYWPRTSLTVSCPAVLSHSLMSITPKPSQRTVSHFLEMTSLPMRSRTTSSGEPLASGFTPHPV